MPSSVSPKLILVYRHEDNLPSHRGRRRGSSGRVNTHIVYNREGSADLVTYAILHGGSVHRGYVDWYFYGITQYGFTVEQNINLGTQRKQGTMSPRI